MNKQAGNRFAFVGPASEAGLASCREQLKESPFYRNLPVRLRFAADLALDEFATNAVKYGNCFDAPFEFRILGESGSLEIEYKDQGVPFNPWEHRGPSKEILESIEKTPIGGRGLKMLKELSASRRYGREDNRNVVALTVMEESEGGGPRMPSVTQS